MHKGQPSKKQKIIYILGSGRSGTSLLEILLGNHPEIFNCGELNRFPSRNGYPPLKVPNSSDYNFWMKIREKAVSGFDLYNQQKLHKKFEYHVGLVKRLFGIFDRVEYQQYRKFVSTIFEELFKQTDQPIITDSSKYPGRALNLSEFSDFEVKYIYIKRNPMAVVRSFAKKDLEQPSKGWIKANVYYFVVNLLCQIVYRRVQKKHITVKVKYEDLVRDPVDTIGYIEKELGISFHLLKTKIKAENELNVGNLFDGNRIRLKESIKLKTKPVSPTSLTLIDRITKIINLPLYHH